MFLLSLLFPGVVFYGERAVERHVKAVHPSEVHHYFVSDTKKEAGVTTVPTRQCSTGILVRMLE